MANRIEHTKDGAADTFIEIHYVPQSLVNTTTNENTDSPS